MAALPTTRLSVETLAESHIQEIAVDGLELYSQPLSMSDHLTKLANKIDFSEFADDYQFDTSGKGVKAESICTQKDRKKLKSQQPFDAVKIKLRKVLSECCALSDVLLTARQGQYMTLDKVSLDAHDAKASAQLFAKKKALIGAAAVIASGAESIKKTPFPLLSRNADGFCIELIQLRKYWRLRKIGNDIIGDLSYRSVGSRFWQCGLFEVSKCEESEQSPSTLKVTVPSELEGVSYIQVTIQKESSDVLNKADLTCYMPTGALQAVESNCQQKLEAAQNVLFCKELFAQLAREAVQLHSNVPHLVVGNHITCTLFPGIQLCISLYHCTSHDQRTLEKQQVQPPPRSDHNHILEHSLHQLLRQVHMKQVRMPMPHPTTAHTSISRREQAAGPQAATLDEQDVFSKRRGLLDQIIDQTQHIVLRIRTAHILDMLAHDIKDPQLMIHWNALNSATHTCVRVNITFANYEAVYRTSMIFHIVVRNIRVVCRDGRVMTISHEPQELRDLVHAQVCQHHIQSALAVCKHMGWRQGSNSTHIGIGECEGAGSASSAILLSPNLELAIAIRCSLQLQISVSVRDSLKPIHHMQKTLASTLWEKLDGEFVELNWKMVEGKNFLEKLESLMVALTEREQQAIAKRRSILEKAALEALELEAAAAAAAEAAATAAAEQAAVATARELAEFEAVRMKSQQEENVKDEKASALEVSAKEVKDVVIKAVETIGERMDIDVDEEAVTLVKDVEQEKPKKIKLSTHPVIPPPPQAKRSIQRTLTLEKEIQRKPPVPSLPPPQTSNTQSKSQVTFSPQAKQPAKAMLVPSSQHPTPPLPPPATLQQVTRPPTLSQPLPQHKQATQFRQQAPPFPHAQATTKLHASLQSTETKESMPKTSLLHSQKLAIKTQESQEEKQHPQLEVSRKVNESLPKVVDSTLHSTESAKSGEKVAQPEPQPKPVAEANKEILLQTPSQRQPEQSEEEEQRKQQHEQLQQLLLTVESTVEENKSEWDSRREESSPPPPPLLQPQSVTSSQPRNAERGLQDDMQVISPKKSPVKSESQP